jgi:prepilin signal peptidase PulO-like enzyme (type II secretory pathway)
VIEGSAWTALGFAIGMAGGGALAAWLAGKRVMAGRRCPNCDASLSPLARFPLISWFGALPRCPACGDAVARLHPALEAAFLLIGLAAILAAPLPLAIFLAVGGWAALFVLLMLWQRLR